MPSFNGNVLSSLGVETGNGLQPKDAYRVVIMGAAGVGKSAIVHQFLYDVFLAEHTPTVEELHVGECQVGDTSVTLDLLDTSGSYEFPAMRRLAISTGDVFVLVYAIDDPESFEEVRRLRDQILEARGSPPPPIVVVGNKADLEDQRAVKKEVAETVVAIDWENGFVETCAKTPQSILAIFKELLIQAKVIYDVSPTIRRRRTSLPNNYNNGKPTKESNLTNKRNSCAVS